MAHKQFLQFLTSLIFCKYVQDISLPPSPSPGLTHLPSVGAGGVKVDPTSRNILVFFAGDLTR